MPYSGAISQRTARGEGVAGVKLDEVAVEKLASATFLSMGGPVALPLHRDALSGPLVGLSSHNLREGMHALHALVKYRQNAKARSLAEANIAAIFELWDPDKSWDVRRCQRKYHFTVVEEYKGDNFVRRIPHMLGPLVKLYRTTGHAPALDLALILKEKLLANQFLEDGRYELGLQGNHAHSIGCVLSSLAQLADLKDDSSLLDRIRAFYDNGLWKIRDAVGWAIENAGVAHNPYPDMGEVNTSDDIIETALILGRRGHPEYFEDAELILRAHVLPSQLRDTSFIQDPPNPKGEDGKRDVANRIRGVFGFPAPYGQLALEVPEFSFGLDIVGGTVSSLCEALREATRWDDVGHWVNLLFDHETEYIRVESPYTKGELRVTVKRPAPLFVRIPSWFDPKTMTVLPGSLRQRSLKLYLFFPHPVGSKYSAKP